MISTSSASTLSFQMMGLDKIIKIAQAFLVHFIVDLGNDYRVSTQKKYIPVRIFARYNVFVIDSHSGFLFSLSSQKDDLVRIGELRKPSRQGERLEKSDVASKLKFPGMRHLSHHINRKAVDLLDDNGNLRRLFILLETFFDRIPQLDGRQPSRLELPHQGEGNFTVGKHHHRLGKAFIFPDEDLDEV